ncbi:hypothetical protein NJC38_22670 [Pseudomonas sp. 21LCFQ010]|uniref:hypothetical protein n=1 Tax=Pseudomonas sp. 21LCFQ010 TaxID=2957506 RepID=UPI002096A6AE|nr:hypothetical protein [Pseudomonas sp. 21LCFQ010]MCO8164947.1 hypothetical protein [Pseudomonas sp. 21LCFQ010]
MKTSLSNLFAIAGLACMLSVPALAASPASPGDGQSSSIPHTETAPAGSALPPGSSLPTEPVMGNGMDASGSSVRPPTRISPDIDEQESKDRDARQKILREQDRGQEARDQPPAKP